MEMRQMVRLIAIVGALVLPFIALRVRASIRRFCAARNALLAKYTFGTLDDNSKRNVVKQAEDIMRSGGIHNPSEHLSSLEEKARYGFFALAMGELGIGPALPNEGWHYVRNPFVALLKADKEIWMAKNHMRNVHGVDVSL
jgi:hypothetical protein